MTVNIIDHRISLVCVDFKFFRLISSNESMPGKWIVGLFFLLILMVFIDRTGRIRRHVIM